MLLLRKGSTAVIEDNLVIVEVQEYVEEGYKITDRINLKIIEDPTSIWGVGYLYEEEIYFFLNSGIYKNHQDNTIMFLAKRSRK